MYNQTTLRFPPTPPGLGSARRRFWQRCLLAGTGLLSRLRTSPNQTFGILTYHRVSDDVPRDPAMLNVTPRRFRQQLEGLLRLGYKPHRLTDLVRLHAETSEFPARAFAVVFDDGFDDLFTNVRPVLNDLRVPVTVFLATGYLDSADPFPFADWPGASSSRPLATDQCEQLIADGFVDLGSHTHTHQDFRHRPIEFRRDLEKSLQVLEQCFGVVRPTFSFPYGFADEALTEAARDCHVSVALTAESELITAESDPFCWGRFGATEYDSPRTLAAKLDGWYSGCRAAWRRLRYRSVSNSQRRVAATHPPTVSAE